MRGAALRPFGNNWDGSQIVDNGNNTITMSAAEAMFWWWRVNEILVEWSFTNGSGFNTGSMTIPKYVVPLFDPPSAIEFEFDLVPDFPNGVNQVPMWNSQVVPATTGALGFLTAFITRQGNDNIWKSQWDATFANLAPAVTNVPGANLAGTISFDAIDPVLGYAYSNTFSMYSDETGVTGTCTVTPASFYPWKDVDGNPRYDTLTGAVI